jgi:hypothetical protein
LSVDDVGHDWRNLKIDITPQNGDLAVMLRRNLGRMFSNAWLLPEAPSTALWPS